MGEVRRTKLGFPLFGNDRIKCGRASWDNWWFILFVGEVESDFLLSLCIMLGPLSGEFSEIHNWGILRIGALGLSSMFVREHLGRSSVLL